MQNTRSHVLSVATSFLAAGLRVLYFCYAWKYLFSKDGNWIHHKTFYSTEMHIYACARPRGMEPCFHSPRIFCRKSCVCVFF